MYVDLAVTEKSERVQADLGVAAARPRALSAAEFSLRIVYDLDAVAETWLDFEKDAACTPFQSYRWMQTWQAAAGGRHAVSPLIVLGYRREGLAFILPFAVEPWRGARRLVWLGHALAGYSGPLVDPDTLARLPEDFAAAMIRRVRHLVPGIDYVYLARQPERLCGLPNPFARFRAVPFVERAPFAVLGEDWERFSRAHHSARTLRRLGEKERKLARLGEVAVETISSPVERRQQMTRLVAWKLAQFTSRDERKVLDVPAARSFLREFARVTADDPRYRLYALKSGDRAVALAFCLVGHGRLIRYLWASDETEMARFSPGHLLLVHIFKQAIAEGLALFDLGNGGESYEADWSDGSDAVLVSFVPFTLKGWLAVGLDRIALEAARRVKAHPRLATAANALARLWWDFKGGFEAGSRAADPEHVEGTRV